MPGEFLLRGLRLTFTTNRTYLKCERPSRNFGFRLAPWNPYSDNPFRVVTTGNWSPQWQGQLSQQAVALSAALLATERAIDALLDSTGIQIPDRTMARMDAIAELAGVLQESWQEQSAWALQPDALQRIESLDKAAVHLKAYAELQAALSCDYEPMAWRRMDGEDIARRWRDANDSWLIKRVLGRRGVIQDMKEAGAQGTPDPECDAQTLSRLREHGEMIDRLDEHLDIFKAWTGHTTRPNALVELRELGQRLGDAVGMLADDAPSLLDARGKVKTLLRDGNDLLAPQAAVGRAASNLLRALRRLHEACDGFEALAGQSVRDHFAANNKGLAAIRQTTDTIVQRHHDLRAWCAWQRFRTEAMDLQLAPLVRAIEHGHIPLDEVETTFEAAYCTWWSGAVIGEDDVLREFSTPQHVATIEKFRQIDDRFQRLTAAYIGAKLAGRIPASDSDKRKPSWGVLERQLQERGPNLLPVRKLMEKIPDVVTTLTPCLMMSPLSVAQYLAADQDLFDVVIFDEASQITVWDAVGCLARARQAIVVGDPKQMPPTNFFARADDDPDGDIDMEGDLESILDEMLGASIPARTLNLHYRSRKESLIAFSNSRYYDHRLVTFPAPVYPDQGVRLIRPEGFYARGKARHNQGEAKAVVKEILRRLTHKDPAVRKQSIGVVTFNSEQQTLIEDLLDRARSQCQDIEWAFATDNRIEPVFVKNLETVQGDERDVIMFSVTYGPDESNRVSMNFGPLNRDGGERRLNVAITRARSEMLVFSTLSPDRIDLSRTQARAVADLKHFLEYAERGPAALGAAVHGSLGDFESPFEAAVARALRDKGWEVHPQVGVSAYRIDLAIVHPDAAGRYLAGVECDGAMYHSSAFARERDKIRQFVLEGLGWTLFRIWSTDWWTHKSKAIDTLHNLLTVQLKADRNEREAAAQSRNEEDCRSVPTLVLDADPQETKDFPPSTDEAAEPPAPVPSVSAIRQTRIARRSDADDSANRTALLETPGASDDLFGDSEHRYVLTQFDSARHRPDSEMFFSDDYSPRLSAMIDHVIDSEGPIHEDVLVRRIARHHGFRRAGRQIRERVIGIAKRRRGKSNENVGMFFWRKRTIRHRLAPARHLGRNKEMRNIVYICREELRKIHSSLSLNDDPAQLARMIGIARLSKRNRQRIMDALDLP